MKALILEDNNQKLENATRVLQKFSIDHVHFNNWSIPYEMFIVRDKLKEFDLIVLDLFFYDDPPLLGEYCLPSSNAGFSFLLEMAEYECNVPVIIYSSEDDYLPGLEKFFLPTLDEFSKLFKSGPLPYSYYQVEKRYKDEINRHKEFLTFAKELVLGHVHNEIELKHLVSEFVSSKK